MGNEINNPRRIPHACGKEHDWIYCEENPEFTNLYSTPGAIHRYNPSVWGGSYRYLNTSNNGDIAGAKVGTGSMFQVPCSRFLDIIIRVL
ncbi:MAG: hypothetical protein JXR41_13375 [Bacteroidales bacterium]|nr:hypothetical protein [Bacteroidales bacterium]